MLMLKICFPVFNAVLRGCEARHTRMCHMHVRAQLPALPLMLLALMLCQACAHHAQKDDERSV